MKFKLFGVLFEFDYIFLCLIASYLFLDTTGLFVPLSISIFVHELAHIVFLILFNCKITAIKLAVGAILVVYKDVAKKWQKTLSLLSGPMFNIMLSVVFFLFGNETYCAVNFVVGIYNLLPIKGFDGGSVLETLCDSVFSFKIVRIIVGFTTILFCFLIGLFFFRYGSSFNNYSVLLFFLYVITPILLKKILKDN